MYIARRRAGWWWPPPDTPLSLRDPNPSQATRHAYQAIDGSRLDADGTAVTPPPTRPDSGGGFDLGSIDPGIRQRELARLRRLEEQVRGMYDLVQRDAYCAELVDQIAAAHETLRAVGRAILSDHLKRCAAAATDDPEAQKMVDQFVELMGPLIR